MTAPRHARKPDHSPAPGAVSEREMLEWKRLVQDAVERDLELQLQYFGGANQITGYRLFYMLQYAKRAGVGHVAFLSDGVFWIDEATEWLLESKVDAIHLRLPGGILPRPLHQRIDRLAELSPAGPPVTVAAS